MPPLTGPIALSMLIIQQRPFTGSILTCPPSSQVHLRNKLGLAGELRELQLELNRNGPRGTRLLLDQAACTTPLAILARPTRLRLQRITTRRDILILR
jgi:hypothetical protein